MTAETTLAPCPTEREQFEAVFSAGPYEFSMSRWPDHHRYLWPGQYREYHVQAAWEAWQARAQAAPQVPALVPLTRQQLREAYHRSTGCTLGNDIGLAERVCSVVEQHYGITGATHGEQT
ncbi:hypothetical protein AVMA1855_16805 [Acidovorax sp. SUPP1855]|uniref:hypothetical protein n=1 Tax=Acidovorax sp. SUPP1855 TaxID=431774 RepID=UPI0023DE6114|nr:hypothetical protein [Acidovorax sp. SUPP1855]GKS85835.1 hypothetical protein AVMA1855_16805 [Acidovorax sp. SUPP1855]